MGIDRSAIYRRFLLTKGCHPVTVGSHSLPIEDGRLVGPCVPWQLRRCTLCATCALGGERHYGFDCPHFADLRLTHAELFQHASGAVKSLCGTKINMLSVLC